MRTAGKKFMAPGNDIFSKFKDETGEECYYPIHAVSGNHIVSECEIDNCVETANAERFSGNLKVIDRNIG